MSRLFLPRPSRQCHRSPVHLTAVNDWFAELNHHHLISVFRARRWEQSPQAFGWCRWTRRRRRGRDTWCGWQPRRWWFGWWYVGKKVGSQKCYAPKTGKMVADHDPSVYSIFPCWHWNDRSWNHPWTCRGKQPYDHTGYDDPTPILNRGLQIWQPDIHISGPDIVKCQSLLLGAIKMANPIGFL